ncbi:unnamed protein product [Ilex paraguariensis]|uniref:Uncharacterized protein n=1 Tax=Ilex paraguariensis TaxID=185542 RepID=A0ABC8S939_9AQUA
MKRDSNKSVKMLFSKEFEGLHDDGFEGSIDEHYIFREVFFGNDSCQTSNRCLVTGAINFECDYSPHTYAPPCLTGENSVITNEQDSCKLKEGCRAYAVPGSFSEGFALSMKNDPSVNVKRMKLSVDELSNVKPCLGKVLNPSASLKGTVSGVSQPAAYSLCDTITCRLVESSSQGVTSSCYLLKRHVETDNRGDVGDRDVSNHRLSSLNGSDKREVVANKPIASPVSQESHANKLLVANPIITVASKSGSLKYSKPRWKESCFVKLPLNEMLLPRDSLKDPRSFLRYHINHLLIEAGWEIGRRRRSNKFHGLGEYVYKSPPGRPIREFHRAWEVCGQTLFDDADSVVQETDSKQWLDLSQFWSDLSNTIQEIEGQLDNVETTTTLAHRWCLLDPFALVVFIDKTLGVLRAGKGVKARRGFVINSSAKHGDVLALKNVDLSSLPASGSDSTCDQSGHCLFEVPVSSGNENFMLGGSETVSPHQDSNKSSPSCDIDRSDHNGKMPFIVVKDVSMGSSEEVGGFFERKPTYEVGNLLEGYVHDRSYHIPDDWTESNDNRTYVQLRSTVSASELCGPSVAEDSNLVTPEDMDSLQRKCGKAVNFKKNDASFVEAVILKKSAQTKSKKINEIKLPTSYKHDRIGVSASCKGGGVDVDITSGNLDSRSVQECLVAYLRNDKSRKKSPLGSVQCWNDKKQFKTKKFQCSNSSKKLVQVTYARKHLKEPIFENSIDEAPVCLKSLSLDSQTWRHNVKSTKLETHDENRPKRVMTCTLNDDDLLISAVIKPKNFRSTTKQSSQKRMSCKSKSLRKHKSQKGSCRLLPRNLIKGGKHFMDGKWSAFTARTVLSWLIHSGVVSLNEVIQFRNPKDDAVVKDGLITWDGILCRCCGEVFSVSEFKIHSGFRLNHSCLNLFLESGKPFTLCQLEAWSAEYKARKSVTQTVQGDETDQNDDSCGLCGDGGELICCDNCPSTFHQACLNSQELPEGSWYCAHCSCWICGAVVNDSEESPGALKCWQCEHKYHEDCLQSRVLNRVASDNRFCGESCQEVYSGLHSRIGFMNMICDGFSWTVLRCIHGDQKVHSGQRFVALKAECNSKLAVALTIMEDCFLPMVDPRTGIDMIPHVLYNWGSQFARLNYHGFYTVVLEKDDVLMSVASIRIHGVTIAEMPLIATCSKYRRQGMCRRLLNSIEEMLKFLKIEKLVISAIPNVVDTWTVGFGFQPLEDDERQSLSNINLMVFPGTIWLKKCLCENQPAVQQTGANERGEVGFFSKVGPDSMQQLDDTSCDHEVDVEMEFRPAECKNLQVDGDQDENLLGHFSELSFKEPASESVGNQVEVLCHVESLNLYDERVQENEK